MAEEMQTPATTPEPAQPTNSQVTNDDKLMAALSYLWIVSIIMLIVKKDREFVVFHAKQGLVIFLVSTLLWIISIPLFFLWLINWIFYIGLFILAVFGFIKAYSGEKYKIPLIGDLASKIKF